MLERLVVFGASGDLTARKLMPALAELLQADRLPGRFSVLGVARRDWDTGAFRAHVGGALESHAADLDAKVRGELLRRLDYCSADVSTADGLRAALGDERRPIALYLALPPALVEPVAAHLPAIGLHAGSLVVCEKPFGTTLRNARKLNRLLRRTFPEPQVFRVDHFLLKQTIQNILGLRFGNRLLEAAWNRDHIARVEILYDETMGLERRAGYYDRTGALRDMIQSHLLQLLALVAMEVPLTMGPRDLRDKKVEVLRAVRRLSPAEVGRWTLRARYAAGHVDGDAVRAYVDEEGVEPDRETETFAEVALRIDNWRWAGVPFVLRSGKRLGRDRQRISVHFRDVPHLAFADSIPCENVLRLALAPDRLELAVNVNAPDEPLRLACVSLGAELAAQALPAYARLLLHVLDGDATLSIRGDEAEEAWQIVEPIVEAWKAGRAPLREYAPGSDGPTGDGRYRAGGRTAEAACLDASGDDAPAPG